MVKKKVLSKTWKKIWKTWKKFRKPGKNFQKNVGHPVKSYPNYTKENLERKSLLASKGKKWYGGYDRLIFMVKIGSNGFWKEYLRFV